MKQGTEGFDVRCCEGPKMSVLAYAFPNWVFSLYEMLNVIIVLIYKSFPPLSMPVPPRNASVNSYGFLIRDCDE